VELKRVHSKGSGMDTTKKRGSKQLVGYLDALSESEGWLLIFDQRKSTQWSERLWSEEAIIDAKQIHLRGA